MITKDEFLTLLTIADLKNIAEKLYLNFSSKHTKTELVKIIKEGRNSKKDILNILTLDKLKHLCNRLDLTVTGRKNDLIERIIGRKETVSSKKEFDKNYNDAINFYRSDRVEESLPFFKKAIKSHPKKAQYYFEYSKALRKAGKIKDAIKEIEKAIEIDSNNILYYTELGFYHLKDNSFEDVITSYRTALRMNKNQDMNIQKICYQRIGLASTKLERYWESIQQYEQLIKINPNDTKYYKWLAEAQEKVKLFKDARKNYDEVRKKEPNNTFIRKKIIACLKKEKEIKFKKDISKEKERFLIDGSNICRSFLPTGKSASISVLISLLSELLKRGNIFYCIFDANMRYVLQNNHEERKAEEVYISLLKNYNKFFNEVPGGIRADSFILQISNRTGERIITNDTFKKDRSDISAKYPWITSSTKRLVKGKVMDNHIIIPDLSINIPLEKNTTLLAENLEKLIKARIDIK